MPSMTYDEVNYLGYYNRYYSDDYYDAYLGEYPLQSAEVHTVHEETHTDSKGNRHTTRTTLFYGLFSKVQMNYSINTTFKIENDYKKRKS